MSKPKRLFAHLLVLLLVAGATVAVRSDARAAESIVGAGTVHAGVYSDAWEAAADLNAMAAWAGKKATFNGTFHDVLESEGSNWSGNTAWKLEQAWRAKSTPVANFAIPATAASIAAGTWDADILTWARRVKAWTETAGTPQRSLFIAPLQEHNGQWVPYGCDPTNFKAAYARIRSLVESVVDPGVVRWVWAPNGWNSNVGACAGTSLGDYYPGADIVDVIGYSAYRWGEESVYAAVGGVANDLRAIDATKPVLVLQTAAWKTGSGTRNQWTRDLFAWAAADPNVVGIVWFNFDKTNAYPPETDWRIWNSSTRTGLMPGWKDALRAASTVYQWPLTDWFQPGPLPFTPVRVDGLDRLAGPNRYATAVAVSADAFGPGVPVAYVATGTAFPDALAAAAAAGALGGPVLLVPGPSLPAETRAEIERLAPQRIVVVGGPAAVSETVVDELTAIQANTVRIGGVNRFDTAALIATDAFAPGVPIAYVATGRNFPDALAAAAAAGAQGGPVLLTETDVLPAPTRDALVALDPAKVVVVGGVNAVSAAVEAELAALQSNLERIAGLDRYDTAARLAGFVSDPATVFVATGLSFPDALAGAAVAGRLGVPLLLTRPELVPPQTAAALAGFDPDPSRVVVLGGTSVVFLATGWGLRVAAG